HASEVLDGLDEAGEWDVFIDSQPPLSRELTEAELDQALQAMADLVDMKSPLFAGHGRGVAALTAAAATMAGWRPAHVDVVRRAGGAAGGSGARSGPAGRLQPDPRQAGRLDQRRTGTRPAASVPHRPDAGRPHRARRQSHHRRPPPRTAGRIRLPLRTHRLDAD